MGGMLLFQLASSEKKKNQQYSRTKECQKIIDPRKRQESLTLDDPQVNLGYNAVAGMRSCPLSKKFRCAEAHVGDHLARLLWTNSYKAVFETAFEFALRDRSEHLFLTSLGGSAFLTDTKEIRNAIFACLKKYKQKHLWVFFVVCEEAEVGSFDESIGKELQSCAVRLGLPGSSALESSSGLRKKSKSSLRFNTVRSDIYQRMNDFTFKRDTFCIAPSFNCLEMSRYRAHA